MTSTDPFSDLDDIVTRDAPLAPMTWFKIGGPARWLIRPQNTDQLALAARRCAENSLPMYVLGLGANLLVSDEGVPGVVFRLDADFFRRVKFNGPQLEVGAGADLQKLVLRTVRQGLGGFEVMAGIPGTIGGGIRMNAGGKFGDIGAIVKSVTTMDVAGNIVQRTRDELVFEYRHCNIDEPFILGATLDLEEEDPERIMKRTKEIWMFKRNSQPLSTKSAGCIFKNPRGLSAGALIDKAGLKGLSIGGAEVSDKHANFIIARPGCTAADIQQLIKIVQERVLDRHQVALDMEVQQWP